MDYRSRLQSRYSRSSSQKIVMMLGISFVFLILILTVGLPALFGFSEKLSTWRRGPSTQQIDRGITPSTPYFTTNFFATPSATIKLRGYSDPKTTVEIFQNQLSQGTTIADSDGKFSMDINLSKGDNHFTAVAANDSGIKSAVSEVYSIKYLSSKPKLELDDPKNNTVSGKTDPENTITVADRLVIVSKDGSFSYVLNLPSGDQKVTVVATDPAGNSTSKELKVSITTP